MNVYMPLSVRETSVSVQAFYRHCSLKVVKYLQAVSFVVGVLFQHLEAALLWKGQIGQQRCRSVSGAYLGLFASKFAVSLGAWERFDGWPW